MMLTFAGPVDAESPPYVRVQWLVWVEMKPTEILGRHDFRDPLNEPPRLAWRSAAGHWCLYQARPVEIEEKGRKRTIMQTYIAAYSSVVIDRSDYAG